MSIATNSRPVATQARRLYSASRKLARKGSSKARAFFLGTPFWSLLIGCAAGIGLGWILRPRG